MNKKIFLLVFFIFPAYAAVEPTRLVQVPNLRSLTEDQKIGQLLMVATFADPTNPISLKCLANQQESNAQAIYHGQELHKLIDTYNIGNVLFLGNSTAGQLYEMTKRLLAHYDQASTVPPLFALDAEWGPAMRLTDAVKYPFALNGIPDSPLLNEIAQAIGKSLSALNIGINLAPVGDCLSNPKYSEVMNRRSQGQNPMYVANRITSVINGLQRGGTLTCVKHAPGLGETEVDSHCKLPTLHKSLEALKQTELIPFKEAVLHGTDAVMVAHVLIPALDFEKPATLSQRIIETLLRKECNFYGPIMTDALNMGAIINQYSAEQSAVMALQAGCDLLVAPVNVPATFAAIKKALAQKIFTQQEFDAHVARILALKSKLHIQYPPIEQDPLKAVANDQLIALSKRAYAQSMTLVRNSGLFPLQHMESKKLVIITIGNENGTIFSSIITQQIKNCMSYNVTQPNMEEFFGIYEKAQHAHTVIFCLQGLTYAKPTYDISDECQLLIKNIAKTNQNVALVLLGNPYALELFEDISTVLVGYEDHPFAQEAAALVLLGNVNPVGKLPVDCSPSCKIGCGLSYPAAKPRYPLSHTGSSTRRTTSHHDNNSSF